MSKENKRMLSSEELSFFTGLEIDGHRLIGFG